MTRRAKANSWVALIKRWPQFRTLRQTLALPSILQLPSTNRNMQIATIVLEIVLIRWYRKRRSFSSSSKCSIKTKSSIVNSSLITARVCSSSSNNSSSKTKEVSHMWTCCPDPPRPLIIVLLATSLGVQSSPSSTHKNSNPKIEDTLTILGIKWWSVTLD